MTDQEKAAWVVPTPEAAIQKTDRVIIVGNLGRVNQTMLQAMCGAGLAPHKPLDLQDDGKVHRYRVEGDKPGSSNGWYVAHSGPVPAGVFGSWKTGEQHTWRGASSRALTVAEQADARKRMQAMQRAREAELWAVQASVRDKAALLWGRAKPATNDHPYLQKKQVPAIGIRCLRDKLLIPLRDSSGVLHSLQFIGPDGTKRFLSGGRIGGCYCAIGRPRNALLLCEGYATAATVFAATGEATAVAFNAGNLPAVARALRVKFPNIKLVICADDDAQTPGNPGRTKATEAARAVGGFVAVPRFEGVRRGV